MSESDTPSESSLQFPCVDWVDGMSGEDDADYDRQAIARGVLQMELWHHEKVVAFFAPWWGDVAGELEGAAAAIEHYAMRSNRRPIDVLPLRAQHGDILRPEALGYSADDVEILSAYEDARRKTEIAGAACVEVQMRRAVSIADFIVGTFSIPLPPWTAVALLRLFVTEFFARLIDADFTLTMVPPEPTTEADFTATLHVPQGSTAEESRAAVLKFSVAALMAMGWAPTQRLHSKPSMKSRRRARPKNEGEALELDARWFCRAILYDEGPTEIARKAGVSRQRVQHAIKRVFALLREYVLPPPESAPSSPGAATP